MKSKGFVFLFLIALFFSGCVVYSFYPLYTENDLFANDILTGVWVDNENSDTDYEWRFEHPQKGKNGKEIIDSTKYVLTLTPLEDDDTRTLEFIVHVIRLGENYFLDFYLHEFFDGDELDLGSFHIIPVHTFARLTAKNNQLTINWFDHNWLSKLIEENKIRIHHESNEEFVLLTAKPRELQKFVAKYVNSAEAFKDGLEVELVRKK